jgi:ATP-dependent exoDNAse (exonuclease V) beta subunit
MCHNNVLAILILWQGQQTYLVHNSYYQLKFVSNLTEENGVLIDRKLNVALTRARKQMFVTGVPKYLKSNPLYESLLNLIETQG